MGTITFIQSPPYSVDFSSFAQKQEDPENLPLYRRVDIAVILRLAKYVTLALAQAAYLSLRYAPSSFKHAVLGWHGTAASFDPPRELFDIIFRIFGWALGIFACFMATTTRLLLQHAPSDLSIAVYAGEEMDVSHIRTDELVLDASSVPAEIQVSTLLERFNQINFYSRDLPGYMPPTSRQEEGTVYSVAALREALNTFVQRVTSRTSFLGTPPAYDTPRLMAFYSQIENAVRLSLHQTTKDLAAFKQGKGDAVETYDPDTKKAYTDLLHKEARAVLDLAIAGLHCGARYMGDAVMGYMFLQGDSQIEKETLQGSLTQLLALKRREVAQHQIQLFLGTDTHAFTNYMQNLGTALALPGTGNVIEHLSTTFNRPVHLQAFFQEYTVDLIIATVQEKIIKSQAFREKLIDWLKDQVGEWKKEEFSQRLESLLPQVNEVINGSVDPQSLSSSPAQDFLNLIQHLRDKSVLLPKLEKEWDEFIQELFALAETKRWLSKRFTETKLYHSQVNKLKTACFETALGSALVAQLKPLIFSEARFSAEPLQLHLLELEKAGRIRKLLPIEQEVALRLVRKEAAAASVIEGFLDQEKRADFLAALRLEEIPKKGLSPEMMEWLLVSQHILLPQKREDEI